MAQKRVMLAIMFADISGSTSLFEQLGDQKARAAIASCLREVFELIHKFSGKVVKTIGDEVMSVFAFAEKAAGAAGQIHELLDSKTYQGVKVVHACRCALRPRQSLRTRTCFGDAVNLAARMVAQAKARQTIISKSSVDLLPAHLKSSCRFVDSAPIKGKKEEIGIYELLWEEEEDVTSMARSVVAAVTTAAETGSSQAAYTLPR